MILRKFHSYIYFIELQMSSPHLFNEDIMIYVYLQVDKRNAIDNPRVIYVDVLCITNDSVYIFDG